MFSALLDTCVLVPSRAYLTRLFRQMDTAFPDALVTGWEPLAATV
jgi:hypothetical protein